MADSTNGPQGVRPESLDAFEISIPANNSTVPVIDGKVYVRGIFSPDAALTTQQVKAAVYDNVATAPNHNDGVPCDIDGTDFSCSVVPQAGCGSGENHRNLVTAWQLRVTGEWEPCDGDNTFFGNCGADMEFKVHAKACLWFAFAPAGYVGPNRPNHIPESGPLYRPVEVLIPANATAITITVPETDLWTNHSPEGPIWKANGCRASGAVCYKQALQWAEYRDNYGMNPHMTEADVPLNTLTGMWVYNENEGTQEIAIGLSFNSAIPTNAGGARPTKLLLGFHDSYQWSNNEGHVVARVTFTTSGSALA